MRISLLVSFLLGAASFYSGCGSVTGPAELTGSIRVTSNPTGASVFLDGTDKGTITNCTLTKIQAGNHSVKLVKAGYADFLGTTTVTAGQTATVSATLTPATQPGAMAVTPAGGLVSTGPAGGPFAPSSQAYDLQNTGGASIAWTASAVQTWVTIAPASGNLGAGASTTVTVSINNGANTLAAGAHNDTVTFTNATNGTGNTTRPVSLTVTSASHDISVTVDYERVQPVPNPEGLDFPVLAWSNGGAHLATRGLAKVAEHAFTSPLVSILTETPIRMWIIDNKMHNGTTEKVCRTIKIDGKLIDVGTTIYGEAKFILGNDGVIRIVN